MAQRITPDQTLQTTALVHDAWLRLGADAQPTWKSRGHFFGAAAEAMRRILIEWAKRRARMKRGDGIEQVDLDEMDVAIDGQTDDRLLQIHDALLLEVPYANVEFVTQQVLPWAMRKMVPIYPTRLNGRPIDLRGSAVSPAPTDATALLCVVE